MRQRSGRLRVRQVHDPYFVASWEKKTKKYCFSFSLLENSRKMWGFMTNGSHIQFEEGPDGSVKCPLFYEDIVLKASQFSNNTYPPIVLQCFFKIIFMKIVFLEQCASERVKYTHFLEWRFAQDPLICTGEYLSNSPIDTKYCSTMTTTQKTEKMALARIKNKANVLILCTASAQTLNWL